MSKKIILKDYYCIGVAKENSIGCIDDNNMIWHRNEDVIWYDQNGNVTTPSKT